MKWLVVDSLSCPEQFFCSHVDSYSHYLTEAGEDAVPKIHGRGHAVRSIPYEHWWRPDHPSDAGADVLFALDSYEIANQSNARIKIAQTAAICNPMPWDVRKADGSPAYDIMISSIPWMVEAAREKGCRAEFMKLAFDHRALVCSMGVKKDIDCLFVGTVDGNHVKRAMWLGELRDVVTVIPPVWGRDYYSLMARAKTVLHVSAEWARGARNACRLYEGAGLGALVMTDGDKSHAGMGPGAWVGTPGDVRDMIDRFLYGDETLDSHLRSFAELQTGSVLAEETYIQRIPQLIGYVRSL